MKRNVLHLLDSFHQGGSERQAVQIARLMHKRGRYNVHLACLDRSGVLLDEALRIGLDIPEYKLTSFYDFNAVKQVRSFSNYLRKRKIDVVQAYDFYTNVFGMAAGALARIPLRIAARRETDGLRTSSRVERRFSIGAFDRCECRCRGQQLVKAGISKEKIVTVYNGTDTSSVVPQSGKSLCEILATL